MSCPHNMADALHGACGLLRWSVWPWGKEHSEPQPLARCQRALPGFGRSVRSVYEKQPVKLNGTMAAPFLITVRRQGATPATPRHGLHPCGCASSVPSSHSFPCPLRSKRRSHCLRKFPSSLLPSRIMSLQGGLQSGPIDFCLGTSVFLREGMLRHYVLVTFSSDAFNRPEVVAR